MIDALPTGWLSLVKGCTCAACIALVHAFEQAEPPNTPSRAEVMREYLLSESDLDILNLLGQGKTNAEIGMELAMSEKTVKNRLTPLYYKLGSRSRAEAVAMVVRLGISSSRCDG